MLSGVQDEAKSKYTAPEADHDTAADVEKVYLFSVRVSLCNASN